MSEQRRVLVTGGAGFIGSHLADALLEGGFRVVVLDNESTGSRAQVAPEAEFLHGDVRDPGDLARAFAPGIDVVFHVAGQASIVRSYADPTADLEVNVGGTLNVLRLCLEHRVPRLLFASSMVVYGNPRRVPTPESEATVPASYYGVTKLAAERYVHLTAGRTDLPAPLAVTSFRMFNVYGPRQRLDNPYQGVLAIFLGRALRSEPIVIHSDGEQSRDFVFIRDVCRAWVESVDASATHGQVLNVGAGKATSVNQLCDEVLGAFGRTRRTYPVTHAAAQQGDIRISQADVARIGEVLGWRPATSLAEGLLATAEWAAAVSEAPHGTSAAAEGGAEPAAPSGHGAEAR